MIYKKSSHENVKAATGYQEYFGGRLHPSGRFYEEENTTNPPALVKEILSLTEAGNAQKWALNIGRSNMGTLKYERLEKFTPPRRDQREIGGEDD